MLEFTPEKLHFPPILGFSIRDLVSRIIQLSGCSSKIEYAPASEGDVKHSLAKIDKPTASGFETRLDFDQRLAEKIGYHKNGVG